MEGSSVLFFALTDVYNKCLYVELPYMEFQYFLKEQTFEEKFWA
jgi:hypothetical protein